MPRRLVVTGVDGFVGRHLARIAAAQGIEVFGVSRGRSAEEGLSADLAGYVSADLRDTWPQSMPPDAPVVHLAGLAAVGPSFEHPQEYLNANSAMLTHLAESRLANESRARVVIVSTGAVYAHDPSRPGRGEGDAVAFTSPYVVSKILVENQAAYYRNRGLSTVVARPFNHFGPGQGPGFLVPDILANLRELSGGAPLPAGNLATRRDYTDVRDVARAYLKLAFAPSLQHDTYNVASGVGRSGAEVLDALCAALERPRPSLDIDPRKIRATDPASIVGDASRLRDETGWEPQIDFARTIADIVAQ